MASTKVTTPVIKDGAVTSAKLDTNIAIDGNLTVDTNTLYVDSSNNRVGIGTTSPANGKIQIDSVTNQISIETGTSGDGRLHIGHFTNGTFIGTYGDDGGVADVIRFGTHSGDERMRIHSTGDVSFRDTSNNEAFYWDASTASLGIGLGTRFGKLDILNIGGSGSNFIIDAGGDNYYTSGASGVQVFRTGSTERMRITSGGNVLINNTNTALYSATSGSGYLLEDGVMTIARETTADTQPLLVLNDTGVDGKQISFRRDGAEKISFSTISSSLVINTGGGEKMRIDSNGNFGFNETPENSNGTWRNFQIGGANIASRFSGFNDAMFGTGYVFKTDNSEVYKNTEAVSRVFFNNNNIEFQQAASGTAGTAISWDIPLKITSSGKVGIGTTSPTFKLELFGGSGAATYDLFRGYAWNGSANKRLDIQLDNTEAAPLAIYNATRSGGSSVSHSFQVDSSEKMRIDSSGNVGIGTTNPQNKIHIESNAADQFRITRTGVASWSFNTYGSGDLVIDDGTERMRIDSSGRVGIGTSSPDSNLDVVGATGIYQRDNSGGSLVFDDTDIADASVPMSFIRNSAGSLSFGRANRNSSTGLTTGSTESVRITSSGNVGIGTTLSGGLPDKVVIRTGGLGVIKDALMLTTGDGDNYAGSGVRINMSGVSEANSNIRHAYIESATTSTANDHYLAFATNSAGNDATERMRITSSGNVGIGTTSPTDKLTIEGDSPIINIRNTAETESGIIFVDTASAAQSAGIMYDSGASNALIFYNNAITERMRITSGGSLLFGTTDTDVTNNTSGTGLNIFSNGLLGIASTSYCLDLNRTNSTNGEVARFRKQATQVGGISVTGSSTSYNETSDYRLKENVVPITGALDRVDALKPSRFNFIADADTTVDGFLAHELAEVVPEAVTGEKDAVDEEGNAIYQGIDKGKIVPLLVGAIQELKAEIETLKSQINN